MKNVTVAGWEVVPGRRAVGLLLIAGAVVWASLSASAQNVAPPSVGKSVKVGTGLYELVASPSTGTVYVAAAGARGGGGAAPGVYVLNGSSLELVKTFEMAATAPYGIGMNDRTQTVYTTNTAHKSVSAIDLKSGEVKTITSEADKNAHLREVVVDEAANVVYVSSYGQQGTVWAIDGRTNEVSVIQNVGNGPSGLALDKAANRLWVSNMAAHEIAAIDLKTRQVVERFPAGSERPSNLALDAKTGRLFVANQSPGTLSVLDTKAGGKLLAAVPTGAGALDVEFNPSSNIIYVANRGAGTVTVIDGTSYEPVAQLQVGSAPNTISIDTKTGLVYVTSKARPNAGRRGRGRGAADAPAQPAPPPAEDPGADTVTVIRP